MQVKSPQEPKQRTCYISTEFNWSLGSPEMGRPFRGVLQGWYGRPAESWASKVASTADCPSSSVTFLGPHYPSSLIPPPGSQTPLSSLAISRFFSGGLLLSWGKTTSGESLGVGQYLGHNIFFFLIHLFFNWRIIALQNWVGFCQTSLWISHRYTHVPSLWKLPPGHNIFPDSSWSHAQSHW